MSSCSQCYPQYIHCYTSSCNYSGRLASPLPVIGTTVTIASLVCSLLIAADIIRSHRANQPWIPCKFFTLSAASLAPLTIAMKVLMDLTNPTPNVTDQLAKLSSTAFLCNSIASIMPSIGGMANVEIVYNVVGLAILILPTVLNVLIQLYTGMIVGIVVEHVLVVSMLVFVLAAVIFTAVAIPTVRKDVGRVFGEGCCPGEDLTIDVEEYVETMWVMTQTGSPEFVVVRLATSSAASVICLLVLVVMVETVIRMYIMYPDLDGFTEYRWAAYLILVAQTGGVIVGAVGGASRLFSTYSYPMRHDLGWLGIESYWTRNLERFRRKVLHPRVKKTRGRRALGLLLGVVLRVQIVVVKASKVFRLVFVYVVDGLFGCYHSRKKSPSEKNDCFGELEVGSCKDTKLKHPVVLLQGEEDLPSRVLRGIRRVARDLIEEGREEKPELLLDFLIKGIEASHGMDLTGMDFLENTTKCWSLPIVNLASICVALLDARNPKVDRLVRSVNKGLGIVKVIEKNMDREKEFVDMRNVAEVIWRGVEFEGKWLDDELKVMGKTCGERLQWLMHIAKSKVEEGGNRNGNHRDRLVQVEAAISLTKMVERLLKESEYKSNDELFDELSIAIAEVFGWCLAELPSAVMVMCKSRREKKVARAAQLAGQIPFRKLGFQLEVIE